MKNRHRQRNFRRGLAPVELVMAIPLLLFAVALSVIFGAVTCWKVRGEVAARDAVFAGRWPRQSVLPPAPEWRVPLSSRGVQGGAAVLTLANSVFDDPLIRGPLPNGIAIDSEMLDQTNHARVGVSHLTRDPPALAKLGQYSLDVRQPLLDGKWQFWQLGYGSNTSRRLRQLYDLLNVPGALDEKRIYEQAAQQTQQLYLQPAFYVLDRDDEFYAWYGRAPDFHPRLGQACTLDPDAVQRTVDRHIPRIDSIPPPSDPRYDPPGVPRRMTQSFIGLYRSQLRVLQNAPPPLSPAQQAQIAALEQKIDLLEDYLATLN